MWFPYMIDRTERVPLENYFSSSGKKAWKKNQAFTGFEPMNSAMPV